MKVTDIKVLLERIKKHYNNFGYDDMKAQEWHRFLKGYTKESVFNNLDKFILEYYDRPPIVGELIKGATKEFEEERPPVYIQCDLCKEKILIGTDEWDVFETHHRRCSKIDFINREAKRIKGEGIDFNFYRTMSDDELDGRYRKIMNNWKEEHKDLCFTNLFQRV